MQGEFKLYPAVRDNLKNFDIYFIGMSRPELEGCTVSQIRQRIGDDPKRKIVVCVDYSIEIWAGTLNLPLLEQELLRSDFVFISEPAMISHIRALVNDKIPVHHIPHPSNIEAISKFAKPTNARTDEIVALIHRYDNNWIAPYLVTKDIPWGTHAVCLDGGLEKHLYGQFRYIRQGCEFMEFLEWTSRKRCVVDSYHKIHSYGRSAVDCAAIKVPIVGTTWTWAQQYLWPDLTVEPGDVWKQRQLVERLMTDQTFYEEVIDKASKLVNVFSYENKRNELLSKLYPNEVANAK